MPLKGCQAVRRGARGSRAGRLATALGLSVCVATAAHAAVPAAVHAADLADLSLEQLREVVVTTVSRVEQRLDRVAASAYVISAEDIRRSGATTLTEALRLAPTLGLARADANQYAISARGFNNVLANKMLVLIDGRAVYTPLFSGVFWEAQQVLLDDIERIEVVTGPSTALWGSNAVNGLVRIITRSAADTVGTAGSLFAGNQQRGAAWRRGGRLGADGAFRVYAVVHDRDSTRRADGSPVKDQADGVQAGFRMDWAHAGDSVTLQGDAYRSSIDQLPSARHIAGANLLMRWERARPGGADTQVQVYLDHTARNHPLSFNERLDTVDLVAQHSLRPAEKHLLVIGGGLRHADDRVSTGTLLGFVPASRRLGWSRLFVQDMVDLSPRLSMTLAASVERNPYTGTEWLPSARLAWQVTDTSLWWGALSRAIRAPSRIDREYVQPAEPPYLLRGGQDFRSEVSDVLELGYRSQPSRRLSYSVTLFHHRHRALRSIEPTPQGARFANDHEGSTRGAEFWARWRPTGWWRLDAGLVAQHQSLRLRPGAVDLGGVAALGNDPRRQASLRSAIDVNPSWSWDLAVRRVSALPNPVVPGYTAVDSRVAYRVNPKLEIAVVLQNLTDPSHAEWGAANNRAEFERSVLVQMRWRL